MSNDPARLPLHRHRPRPGAAAVLVVLIAGMLLASCAEDDPDASATTSTLAATTTTLVEPTTTTAPTGAPVGDAPAGPGGSVPAADCGTVPSFAAVGPAPVEAVLRRAAELYLVSCPGVEFTLDRGDEDLGFSLLCAGMVDVVGSSRQPSDEELERCAAAGIEPVALPLAVEALVVVTSPANPDPACLGFADLYALFGPESVGVRSWEAAAAIAAGAGAGAEGYPEGDLDLFGPVPGSAERLGFEEMVLAPVAAEAGTEPRVRPDLLGTRGVDELVAGIGATERGIGWLSYDLALANAPSVVAVPLRRSGDDDCVTPTAETVADGTYPASRRLTLWAPRAGAGSDTAREFLRYLYLDVVSVAVGSANGTTGYLTLPAGEREAAVTAWDQG